MVKQERADHFSLARTLSAPRIRSVSRPHASSSQAPLPVRAAWCCSPPPPPSEGDRNDQHHDAARHPTRDRNRHHPPLPVSRLGRGPRGSPPRSEEHTSELQSQSNLVCRLLLE